MADVKTEIRGSGVSGRGDRGGDQGGRQKGPGASVLRSAGEGGGRLHDERLQGSAGSSRHGAHQGRRLAGHHHQQRQCQRRYRRRGLPGRREDGAVLRRGPPDRRIPGPRGLDGRHRPEAAHRQGGRQREPSRQGALPRRDSRSRPGHHDDGPVSQNAVPRGARRRQRDAASAESRRVRA